MRVILLIVSGLLLVSCSGPSTTEKASKLIAKVYDSEFPQAHDTLSFT